MGSGTEERHTGGTVRAPSPRVLSAVRIATRDSQASLVSAHDLFLDCRCVQGHAQQGPVYAAARKAALMQPLNPAAHNILGLASGES